MNELERFYAKVRFGASCFEWTGARTAPGWHGVMLFRGTRQVAHRIAWQLMRGPIPDGLNVLHSCDNAGCVRIEHLFLGTQADNMRDAAAKGRLWTQRTELTHCKRGHLFTEETTIHVHGRRRCRTCHNESRRKAA